jgi:UDP-3-O-[3-hydroxymyristoyl] glucosamine N-acyltransferase
MRDVPDGGKVLWIPAGPEREIKRQIIAISQLPELIRRVRTLEKQVAELSGPKE